MAKDLLKEMQKMSEKQSSKLRNEFTTAKAETAGEIKKLSEVVATLTDAILQKSEQKGLH